MNARVMTLAPDTVARGLNLSRSMVSWRIADGTIHSVKVGNRHRVPYPEYRRLWAESMTKAAEASMDDVEAELFDDRKR